jgi:homoserine trans-succinylase
MDHNELVAITLSQRIREATETIAKQNTLHFYMDDHRKQPIPKPTWLQKTRLMLGNYLMKAANALGVYSDYED